MIALAILIFALVWAASALGTPDEETRTPLASPPHPPPQPDPEPQPEFEPEPKAKPDPPRRGLVGGLLGGRG